MKIAFFHEDYPFGGAEKVTSDLSSYFIDRGHEVYIFVEHLNKDALNDKEVENITFLKLPDKYIYSDENTEYIVENLNSLEIDIFVIPVIMLPNISTIRKSVKSKLIFAHHGMPMWELANKLAKFEKKKLDKGFGLWWNILLWLKRGKYKKRFERIYWNTYDNTDAFTLLCDGYKNELCKLMNIDQDDNRFEVMYNPLHIHEPYSTDKQKEVVYIGRLSYADKRVDRLLSIWADVAVHFPEWKLKIVGDGQEASLLKNIAERDALPRIEFCGHHKNLDDFYNDAAILCMTSAFEGWGLVITEAQQAGVVPMAYDCSAGVAENIGDAGILVANGNRTEYIRRLKELMSDEELRRQYQTKGIEKVTRYSPSEIGHRWEVLFEKLLNVNN